MATPEQKAVHGILVFRDLVLYEKCRHCWFFIDENHAYQEGSDIAPYVHLDRGDEDDARTVDTHDATPSGLFATLNTWQLYGPWQMRERFILKD